MQFAPLPTSVGVLHWQLPADGDLVLPGVRWGRVDEFPSPAYWAYQCMAKRLSGAVPDFQLGNTLAEEVGACILGGHGIPGVVGVAAFEHLKARGAFGTETPEAQTLAAWLQEPLCVRGRTVRYRFANQKARFLAAALQKLQAERAPESTGRALRDWLLAIPGVGLKTASWVARNWLRADDVAILDVHVLRVGAAIGLFAEDKTVERNYLELEDAFLRFSAALGVKASELDAVVWQEMASSPNSVRLLQALLLQEKTKPRRRRASSSKQLELAAAA